MEKIEEEGEREGGERRISSALVSAQEGPPKLTLQPPQPPAHTPLLHQQLRHKRLRKPTSRLRATLISPHQPLQENGVARDPPKSGARGDSLGESVDSDDSALVVVFEVGGDERGDEGFVGFGFGGKRAGGGANGGGVLAGLKEVVWIVLDDDDCGVGVMGGSRISSAKGRRRGEDRGSPSYLTAIS